MRAMRKYPLTGRDTLILFYELSHYRTRYRGAGHVIDVDMDHGKCNARALLAKFFLALSLSLRLTPFDAVE